MSATIELAQTAKRDSLRAYEKRYQAEWEEAQVFQVEAPPLSELPTNPFTSSATPESQGEAYNKLREKHPKWFGNFPFPYMNGSLHLGHGFTISKIEFAAGYQRLLGKRVLFPHGFHVTGMPIKASSDKIIREIELFGQNFENFERVQAEIEATAAAEAAAQEALVAAVQDKSKAKKSKVLAKSTGHKYQFQILESIGIKREDVKKFADPQYWLEYFPPIAMEDHKSLGTRIDWRRTFLTTPANPYYDSFVRWQMNKLHAQNRVKFGKRYTVYSPKDGQPCMDHDRSEGEGLGPTEYTGIRMEVVEWSDKAKAAIGNKLDGKKVFLVAATLRPETMYGQTNCFVGTTITYNFFSVSETEVYVTTKRAARNMAFQGVTPKEGEVNTILETLGDNLVGTKIKAPLSVNPEVYVLPMDNVLPTKGTGVVTSVPSDSPDDFATLTDLQKKPDHFGIQAEWAAFEPIPIISTPTYGDLTAPALVKQLKIQSQKDTKQLAEAKDLAYKEGFYSGTMLVGDFKGEAVQDAKQKVRDSLIEQNLGFAYAEPEGMIVSRSADECVICLMDQWYLDYGEPVWREQVGQIQAKMNFYNNDARTQFANTLAWLNKWACARTYGLGSDLPWDPQFMVESLSDSTIYMSYYTVAHLLHKDIRGEQAGPLDIKHEDLTDEIWDYVLSTGAFPDNSPLPREKADALKHAFYYFYPFDIRSSGRDLIGNHLTFALYNHAAIFPPHHQPLSMRVNGHLMLNGEKMSKSTGNSLTLREAVEKFGADATRLSLADAGDGVEDANFDEKTANASILRVHTLVGWCEEMLSDKSKLRSGQRNYHDQVFEQEVNELINITKGHYDNASYKDALKYGFYEMQIIRDWYREVTGDQGGMHVELTEYWIRASSLMIAPIAPHFAEHIHKTLLGGVSVQEARWPTPTSEVDRSILESGIWMRDLVKTIRDAEIALVKLVQKNKGKKPKGGAEIQAFDSSKKKSVRIYTSNTFPEWQNKCVDVVKQCYDAEKGTVDDAKVKALLMESGLIKDKKAMPFIQAFKKRMSEIGATTAFRRSMTFSESKVLNELVPYLKKTLSLVDVEVLSAEEALAAGYTKMIIETSEPGNPSFEYRNVE